MEQHPVPRNVTGFKFQLIGSMTLKQFLYLAFGVAIGFIAYKLPISTLRFPLAGFFVFLGVAFAFIPIQERPLEVWIKNLIASIYSPTQFIWQKSAVIPLYLSSEPVDYHVLQFASEKTPLAIQQDARQKLDEYVKRVGSRLSPADAEEEASLARVSTILASQKLSVPVVPQEEKSLLDRFTHLGTSSGDVEQHKSTVGSLAPGIVAGLVKTNTAPLANVLVHIYDERGNAVRLLKTNKEGKFAVSLALPMGAYRLELEDPSKLHTFKPFHFTIGVELLNPWLIVPVQDTH